MSDMALHELHKDELKFRVGLMHKVTGLYVTGKGLQPNVQNTIWYATNYKGMSVEELMAKLALRDEDYSWLTRCVDSDFVVISQVTT